MIMVQGCAGLLREANAMGVQRDCMRGQIRRELLRRIVMGVYQPGDRLVELQIAREFNTSQAPVREALRELEAVRLVETEIYRGTRVRAISEQEMIEAAAVRGILEEAAARSAVATLRGNTEPLRAEVEAIKAAARDRDHDAYALHNNRFHRLIVAAGGNEVMLRVWDSLMLEARTRITLSTFPPFDLDAIANSHDPIVDAFEAGDGDLAGQLLREHAKCIVAWRHTQTDASQPTLEPAETER
jgi:DNA-binding GntR family transcriptional regulator